MSESGTVWIVIILAAIVSYFYFEPFGNKITFYEATCKKDEYVTLYKECHVVIEGFYDKTWTDRSKFEFETYACKPSLIFKTDILQKSDSNPLSDQTGYDNWDTHCPEFTGVRKYKVVVDKDNSRIWVTETNIYGKSELGEIDDCSILDKRNFKCFGFGVVNGVKTEWDKRGSKRISKWESWTSSYDKVNRDKSVKEIHDKHKKQLAEYNAIMAKQKIAE